MDYMAGGYPVVDYYPVYAHESLYANMHMYWLVLVSHPTQQ